MRLASLILAPIIYFMSFVSVAGLKEVKDSESGIDPEQPKDYNLR